MSKLINLIVPAVSSIFGAIIFYYSKRFFDEQVSYYVSLLASVCISYVLWKLTASTSKFFWVYPIFFTSLIIHLLGWSHIKKSIWLVVVFEAFILLRFLYQVYLTRGTIRLSVSQLWAIVHERNKDNLGYRIMYKDLNFVSYFFKMRRSSPVIGYSMYKTGNIYSTAVLLATITTLEALPLHVLISQKHEFAAWILTLLNVYGVIYIFGDYTAYRLRNSQISGRRLLIRTGLRADAECDLDNIQEIYHNSQSFKDVNSTELIKLNDAGNPNAVLVLKKPITVNLMFTSKKATVLAIRFDQPKMVIDDILALRPDIELANWDHSILTRNVMGGIVGASEY